MNHLHPPHPEHSDSKYLLILFSLISVVLFFVFLIYFVYGQKQFVQKTASEEIKNIEEIRRTNNLTPKNTQIASPIPSSSTSPIDADISRYNPREPETLSLRGRGLLDTYFSTIQTGEYRIACSLLSNTICNAKRDIYSFSQFLEKINGGYQVKNITQAKEQKPTEAIYCVEYTYTLKSDLNPKPITEFFQYRIKSRPDGGEEISARVCEKIIKDGRERPCPIITPKKYCY
ncbi:MAG: hypothetical protein WC753_00090 [Candidatus Gracilibacteria bacterium]|jgi:hypothetical protein